VVTKYLEIEFNGTLMANKITQGEKATQNQLVIFSYSCLSIDTARIETHSITLPLSLDKFYNPGTQAGTILLRHKDLKDLLFSINKSELGTSRNLYLRSNFDNNIEIIRE